MPRTGSAKIPSAARPSGISVPRRAWSPPEGMLALALGYFLCYLPFAALTKALSAGLVPGFDESVGGLVLLPAAALGVLIAAIAFLVLNGWWRYIGVRRVAGSARRVPGATMLAAGLFMALIVATTILNFTFAGVSILFMLLMMRAGTLGLAPAVDLARRRSIRGYSWAGLALSLLAIVVALGAVDAYAITAGAAISLALYFAGYVGRFEIMSRVAKTGDEQVDRRYFAEEQLSSASILVLLCGVLAAIGAGPAMQELREGFTSFLFSASALPALAIGLFYGALYVFGTLIYLDAREYTWSVPVNRSSSVFAVLLASYALSWAFGVPAPATEVLVATAFVLLAVLALSYPQLRALARRATPAPSRGLILFVCGGNTGRSPIAAALTRAELAAREGQAATVATSAGVAVATPGAPIAPAALAALRELGVPPHPHGAQALTRELCERADIVFCMTEEQRLAVISLAPGVASKTFRLDPESDLPEPDQRSSDAWKRFAIRARELIRARLENPAEPQLAAARA